MLDVFVLVMVSLGFSLLEKETFAEDMVIEHFK